MRTWIATLLVAAGITSGCCQRPSVYQVFQMQSQCAELAHKWEAKREAAHNYFVVYSHYDLNANRCWVKADETTADGMHYFLMDGQSLVAIAFCNTLSGEMHCGVGQDKKSRADVDQYIAAKMGRDAPDGVGTALRVD